MNRRALFVATIGVAALAGCTDAPISEPTPRTLAVTGPTASIEKLTNEPIIFDQRATGLVPYYVYPPGLNGNEAAFLLADDFTLTGTATVTYIAVSGFLNADKLPFSISKDFNGLPGLDVGQYTLAPDKVDQTQALDSTHAELNDYLFKLPTPLVLPPGKYWLTVINGEVPSSRIIREIFGWQTHTPANGAVGREFNPYLGGGFQNTIGSDTDFAFSVFGSMTQAQTITFPDILPNPAALGTTATLGATASSGLTVTYTSLTTSFCTVSGTTLTYVGRGLCQIAADQAGDATFSAATRVTKTVSVGQGTQKITFTSTAPSGAVVGDTYNVSATGGASGNPVTFSTSPTSVCTVSGSTVSFVSGGQCTVAANQAGNADYTAAPQETQVMSVGKLSQTIAFTSTPPAGLFIGATYNVTATGGASGIPVVFTTSPSSVCTNVGSTVTIVGFGTCTIAANQAGNAAYTAALQVTQTASATNRFEGFAAPVNNDDQLNLAKAGQTIPLKWRLTDPSGNPITSLASVSVTVKDLSCAASSTEDQLEEYAAGGSGLQNLGNGYYQYNWKTPKDYAGSCKTLTLVLGTDGVTHTALFKFTK